MKPSLNDPVELAKKLVSFPTTAGREGLILEFLEEALRGCGFAVSRQPVPGAGENLIAARGEGGVWLVTHLDVFPPYEHPQPFSPRVEGEELVGRGAVDTKGQLAALLSALATTQAPAQVALVVDEESLGRGSAALEVPPGIVGAVVLEPTGLRLAPAEAGSLGLFLITTGKEAHGSLPWRGKSAVELAFSLYEKLKNLPFVSHTHPLFEQGGWVNLGRIQGGYDTMLVPNRCELELDIGFAPGLPAAQVAQQVRQALAEAETMEITDIWEPWETSLQEEIVRRVSQALAKVLGKVTLWGMPSWTDGANLVRKGVPTVILGAGDLALAHSFREALPLPQLFSLSEVLAELLRSVPEGN